MLWFSRLKQSYARAQQRIRKLLQGPHTVFLFGAGASAFSLDCGPIGCPPVGSGLFAKLRKKQGSVASLISNQLAGVFNRSFEDGVDQLWDTHPEYLIGILRETALYLAHFEPGRYNLYRRLVRHLIDSGTHAVLATINYDLLIEMAVSAEGRQIAYGIFPAPLGNMLVIKIHGSINFLPEASIRNIGFVIARGNTVLEGAKIHVARSPREVIDWCTLENGISPALALYTKRKPVLICRDYVRHQMGVWYRAMDDAKQVYVIGVHLNTDDHHIWDVLEHSKAEMLYVGPEGDDVLKWARQRGRSGIQHFAESFEEAVARLTNRPLVQRGTNPWDPDLLA